MECIPVCVSALELECLSCICGFLNALLKTKCNYNIWIRITIFFTFCPLYSWLFSAGVVQQRYFLVQPTMCSKLWRKDLRNHFLNKLKLDTASSNHKETSEWIISVWRGNYNQCVNLSRTFLNNVPKKCFLWLGILVKLWCPISWILNWRVRKYYKEEEELGGFLENVCKSSIPVKTWNWQYKLITSGYWLLPYLFVSTQSCPSVLQVVLCWVKYFLTLSDWTLIDE